MKKLTHQFCRQAVREYGAARKAPAGFRFQFCTMDDLDEILAIGRAAFDYDAPTRAEIAYALTKAHGGVFGLFDTGRNRYAGYLLIEAHGGRKNLYINTTMLAKEYRGRGLGQALYEFKDFLMKACGARSLWCHTAIDNKANIHLLNKNGFETIRQEDDYYEDGRAALVMRKTAKS